MKEAVEAQGKMQIHWGGQPPEDALAALGFNVDKLGAEAYLKPAKQAPRQRALARPRSKPSSAPASAVEPKSSSASVAGESNPLRFSQPVHRSGAGDVPKHNLFYMNTIEGTVQSTNHVWNLLASAQTFSCPSASAPALLPTGLASASAGSVRMASGGQTRCKRGSRGRCR